MLLDGCAVKEAEVSVILPLGSLEKSLVLALEHGHELLKVDSLGSVSGDSLLRVQFVPGELLLEDLGVGVVALLGSASVSVAGGISKNDFFSLERSQHGSSLVKVLDRNAVSGLHLGKDLSDVRRVAQLVLGLVHSSDELVDNPVRKPEDRLGDLIV